MAAEVHLLTERFKPAAEFARFVAAHPDAGGIVSVLGQVRGGTGANPVLELELTHYPLLTQPGIETIAADAERRWPLTGLLILHRVGSLAPGEPIVLVAAAARHRRDAFAATDFAMDHLKSEAWFWKRERTADGWRWIEPRDQDHADRARWESLITTL